MGGNPDEERVWTEEYEATRRRPQECQRYVWVLTGYLRLLSEYLPTVFIVGYLVRECHWSEEGRLRGSGTLAREVICMCLLVMEKLLGERAPMDEYVRCMLVTLVQWRRWGDEVPACCYSEEPNEAMLSRLASECTRNPRLHTVDNLMDLFLTVRPAHPGVHAIECDRPGITLVAETVANLQRLGSTERCPVTYVPGRGDTNVVTAEDTWPETCPFPETLLSRVDQGVWRGAAERAMRVLLGASVVTDSIAAALDRRVARRDGPALARVSEAWRAFLTATGGIPAGSGGVRPRQRPENVPGEEVNRSENSQPGTVTTPHHFSGVWRSSEAAAPSSSWVPRPGSPRLVGLENA